ncbi:MAG: hypothetical protein ACU0CV_05575, partial [Sagittula sp.]
MTTNDNAENARMTRCCVASCRVFHNINGLFIKQAFENHDPAGSTPPIGRFTGNGFSLKVNIGLTPCSARSPQP